MALRRIRGQQVIETRHREFVKQSPAVFWPETRAAELWIQMFHGRPISDSLFDMKEPINDETLPPCARSNISRNVNGARAALARAKPPLPPTTLLFFLFF